MSPLESSNPDLIFGIDVGMSCTGVAYLNTAKTNHVQLFRNWGPWSNEYKVPTRLSYLEGDTEPCRWGFAIRPDDPGEVKEWFKIDFGNHTNKPDQTEVKRLYTHYLKCLYTLLRREFPPTLLGGKHWDKAKVHFYFSVPATWSLSQVADFRKLAIDAGFGSKPGFKVETSLTEPQAVAAFTMAREKSVKDGQRLLIIDAGGATVDLCFIVVDDATKGKLSLTEVRPVQGTECGSTFIDSGFEDLVKQLLRPLEAQGLLETSASRTAWQMRRTDEFQSNKRMYGSGEYSDDQTFQIKIPGLKVPSPEGMPQIRRGEMVFKWSEFKQLFDRQIAQIIKMMEQIQDAHNLHNRSAQVDHIILSGGLGSSQYVQQEIAKHTRSYDYGPFRNANLHQSTEPQVSVAYGLVEHAKQELAGSTMFTTRLSRCSLGVSCRLKCKTSLKWGLGHSKRQVKEKENVTVDALGQAWKENHMDWFVKWNDKINNNESIRYSYSMEFDAKTDPSRRVARVKILSCLEESIPDVYIPAIVQECAKLEVNLSRVSPRSIEQKRGKLGLGSKKPVVKVHFLIQATVGAADVKFECLDSITKLPFGNSADVQLKVEKDMETLSEIPSLVREEW